MIGGRNDQDRPLRVLLVEDDRGDALLVQKMLSEATTTEVEWADRLAKALDALASGRFDLVLLDLGLPDAHNLEGLARLLATGPPVPVVVLTGLDDDVSAIAALEHGAQDYLVKGSLVGDLLARTIRYSVERHRVQQALIEHEELYQALVDSIPELVYSRDPDGFVTFIGATAAAVYGIERDQLYARRKTWYDFVHPSDRERVKAEVLKAVAGGRSFKLEYRIFDAHGRLCWFIDHGRSAPAADHVLARIDGILFDITERKRREELREIELMETREALDRIQTAAPRPTATLLQAVQLEEDLASLEDQYVWTLRQYVDARETGEPGEAGEAGGAPDRSAVVQLAERLVRQTAAPNDIVRLHLQAVQTLSGSDSDWLLALSRLLLLELLAHLAEHYRQMALAAGASPADRSPSGPGTERHH